MGKPKNTKKMNQDEKFEYLESLVRTALGQASKSLKMSKELRKACNIFESDLGVTKRNYKNINDRLDLVEAESESLSSSIEFYSGISGDTESNKSTGKFHAKKEHDSTIYLPEKKKVAGYEFKEIEEVE